MKRQFLNILLAGSLMFFGTNSYAQVDSVKAAKLKQQLIDTVCICVSQTDTSKIKTADDVEQLMMQCFMGNGMSIFMDYAGASGVDLSNTEQMQGWARKLGMELTLKCPAIMTMLSNVIKDPAELKKLMEQSKGAMNGD